MLSIDRRVYLHWIRNIQRGLVTRSEIIRLLDRERWRRTSEIASQVHVTAGTVLYHLQNMAREAVVVGNPEGAGWRLGPIQQSSLTDFLKPTRKRSKKKKGKKK
ncbi:MAG: ArsR family transcriptional regulator [Candidatus Thorarchaeota archaeon]